MHRYLHILTDTERIVDPDGQSFSDIASAGAEAKECARLLMAEELLHGRPLPIRWKVQIADDEGTIVETFKFEDIVLEGQQAVSPLLPVHNRDVLARAKAIFFGTQKTREEIRVCLLSIQEKLDELSRLNEATPSRSGLFFDGSRGSD